MIPFAAASKATIEGGVATLTPESFSKASQFERMKNGISDVLGELQVPGITIEESRITISDPLLVQQMAAARAGMEGLLGQSQGR